MPVIAILRFAWMGWTPPGPSGLQDRTRLRPWSQPKLVVGTGHSGRLPVMEEVHQHADHHGVQLIVSPIADAVPHSPPPNLARHNAILHVTC